MRIKITGTTSEMDDDTTNHTRTQHSPVGERKQAISIGLCVVFSDWKEEEKPICETIRKQKLAFAHNMQSVLAGSLLKKLSGTEGSL